MGEQRMKTTVTASALAVFGLMLLSAAGIQQALAHASTTVTVDAGPAEYKVIRVVIGHSSEPSFGALPGIHDGKHNLEVSVTDDETRMPLGGAELEVDKFYFESISKFKAAKGPHSADEVETGVALEAIFGETGHYVHRQLQKDGIYGYRLYGTINYFGEGSAEIDKTVFCATESGGTSKFNKGGWSGAFGCTEDIEDLLFPEDNEEVEEAGFGIEESQGTLQQASMITSGQTAVSGTTTSQGSALSLFQMLAVGGTATVGGFFGIRAIRNRVNDERL